MAYCEVSGPAMMPSAGVPFAPASAAAVIRTDRSRAAR
jgi:hypothetical protein